MENKFLIIGALVGGFLLLRSPQVQAGGGGGLSFLQIPSERPAEVTLNGRNGTTNIYNFPAPDFPSGNGEVTIKKQSDVGKEIWVGGFTAKEKGEIRAGKDVREKIPAETLTRLREKYDIGVDVKKAPVSKLSTFGNIVDVITKLSPFRLLGSGRGIL